MNPIARTLWNPIVAKEYRSRMRTWRSPLTITIHVIVLGGIGWAVFSAIANSVAGFGSSGGGVSPSSMGILLFTFLIPGVFYCLWRESGTRRICPSCSGTELVPKDSPRGRKLREEFSGPPPTPREPVPDEAHLRQLLATRRKESATRNPQSS